MGFSYEILQIVGFSLEEAPKIIHFNMGLSENSVPHCTQWLMIIIPMENGYFIGNIPHFQTYQYDFPLETIQLLGYPYDYRNLQVKFPFITSICEKSNLNRSMTTPNLWKPPICCAPNIPVLLGTFSHRNQRFRSCAEPETLCVCLGTTVLRPNNPKIQELNFGYYST